MLQDVVTCIRQKCTIDEAGFRLERHADRFLKDPAEMARLFERHPRGCRPRERDRRALPLLARRAELPVSERDRRPGRNGAGDPGATDLGRRANRYSSVIPDRVAAQLRHELTLIEELEYAPYFLTVNAIVKFAQGSRHPLPGPGKRRQFRRLLCARCHLHRSGALGTSVRALHLAGAPRAARHRRRLRARAAGGSHPVDLRHLWPPPGRPDRRRDHAIARVARCARSARRSACRRT